MTDIFTIYNTLIILKVNNSNKYLIINNYYFINKNI